jgi:carboxymethylenebutenolidase
MQRSLDRTKIRVDMLNGAKYLKAHKLSNGNLGATGFCFGGAVTNFLAVQMGADLKAAAPFYGRAPRSEDVPKIRAFVMAHYAEDDPRVNSTRPGYEAALKASGAKFELHTYPGTRHGFHNNSTPRYNESQAKIAWARTIDLFKRTLV